MNSEYAKEFIKNDLENYLQKQGINTRMNFECLNPDHADNNPSMSIDRTSRSGLHCKCFSCGAYYDTFDIIGIDYGLTDEKEIFKKAFDLYGFSTTEGNTKAAQQDFKPAPVMQHGNQNNDKNERNYNFTKEVTAAHDELKKDPEQLEHFTKRGISLEIIDRYKLGYSSKGHNALLSSELHSKSKKAGLYKYIIPYMATDGTYNYFMSEISDRAQIDDYNGKYRKINNMPGRIWNERYLMQKEPPEVVYICEGPYDGLSIETGGGRALALGGVGTNRLLRLIEEYRPNTTFVIALDNDEPGKKAAQELETRLKDNGVLCVTAPALGKYKDINELLQGDRARFNEFMQQAAEKASAAQHEELEAYKETSAINYLAGFNQQIEESKNRSHYPTGILSLDNLLDGGLYAGLYIVGAISSLGKTTFCLELMDNIAKAGNDVLIFSLEMSRYELMAKSISRHTFIKDPANAKTVRGILTGSRYKDYTAQEKKLIDNAGLDYMEYCDRVYIVEGVGNIGINQIKETVSKHIRLTGNKPVVLIDYIQILAPYDVRATDKQNTDKTVLELKRMSRDYNIPVVGISSFNRESYTEPVTMSAFKESGAIEYGSDVLIGLQYYGMDYQKGEGDKNRKTRIRELIDNNNYKAKNKQAVDVQIKILKNRNGGKGDTVINFYPMFNYFEEPLEFVGEEENGLSIDDLKELF